MVSNNINQTYKVPMEALGQSQPGGVPMQAGDMPRINDYVDNSRVSARINASEQSDYKLPVMVALWFGLNRVAEKFNKACRGEMDTSLLGRAGALGDRVSDSIKSTAPGQFLANVKNGISSGISRLAGKNKVVYALKNTPTSPEWEWAKMPANGLNGFLTLDIKSLFSDFLKPIKNPIALEQYGFDKAYIEQIAQKLKGLSASDGAKLLHTEELKALGVTPGRIEKIYAKRGIQGLTDFGRRLKVSRLGFRNFKDYAKWEKNAFGNKGILEDALNRAVKNQGKDLSISVWRRQKLFGSEKLGKLWSNLVGRKVTLSELRNKLAVTLGKSNAKSTLGRSVQKGMGWLLEGTTGRFGGGKFIPFVMSIAIADSIISTVKAPKGEHIKTFADRTVNDFSYVFALPVGVIAMHKAGGLANAGNTKEQVAVYEKALAEFNANAKAGAFKTKELYNKAWENVKALKPKTKGITKLFNKIGEFITIGNRTKAPYKSASSANLNFLRKLPNFFKNCAGVPLRVWIAMGLVGGFVSKFCTKGAHVIFGRPTKSVLDEDTDDDEQTEQADLQQTNPFTAQTVPQSPTNLINMYKNGQVYQSGSVVDTVNAVTDTAIAAEVAGSAGAKDNEPVRTYIPSADGVRIQGEDTSAAEAAIMRSQAAERRAMETLAMKW